MARRLFGTTTASHVHHQEADDRRHREEMNVARRLIAAEQHGEFLQLHRLPERQPRQHDHDAGDNDAELDSPLHRVVDRKIVVRELEGQRRPGVGDHLSGRIGHSLRRKRPVTNSQHQVDQPLIASSHIAAKCHSSAPASQPPSVIDFGKVNGNSGEAL